MDSAEDHENQSSPEFSPSQEIANVLRGVDGFDEETCDEVAKMDLDEAFETAYGYLTQAGLDADSVLIDFVED